ncbi:hypothetical protein, partial [Streptomyces sp. MBT33]|uniref:hypothetical protein n=1 Tax=Streptomyces sp. MBT33 TaxID=1488363 RepID=UPI001909D24D
MPPPVVAPPGEFAVAEAEARPVGAVPPFSPPVGVGFGDFLSPCSVDLAPVEGSASVRSEADAEAEAPAPDAEAPLCAFSPPEFTRATVPP